MSTLKEQLEDVGIDPEAERSKICPRGQGTPFPETSELFPNGKRPTITKINPELNPQPGESIDEFRDRVSHIYGGGR